MGCIKSKAAFQGSNAVQDERIGGGGEGCAGEKSSLLAVTVEEKGPSSAIVLDYAHRLSREILEQAVKQWAVTESKYSDIPFIESDVPEPSISTLCVVPVQIKHPQLSFEHLCMEVFAGRA